MPRPDDLAVSVDQKCLRNAIHPEAGIKVSWRVNRDRILHGDLLLEPLHCLRILISDSDHLETLRVVAGVNFVEVRDALTAGRTPRCPEFDQERFVLRIRW